MKLPTASIALLLLLGASLVTAHGEEPHGPAEGSDDGPKSQKNFDQLLSELLNTMDDLWGQDPRGPPYGGHKGGGGHYGGDVPGGHYYDDDSHGGHHHGGGHYGGWAPRQGGGQGGDISIQHGSKGGKGQGSGPLGQALGDLFNLWAYLSAGIGGGRGGAGILNGWAPDNINGLKSPGGGTPNGWSPDSLKGPGPGGAQQSKGWNRRLLSASAALAARGGGASGAAGGEQDMDGRFATIVRRLKTVSAHAGSAGSSSGGGSGKQLLASDAAGAVSAARAHSEVAAAVAAEQDSQK